MARVAEGAQQQVPSRALPAGCQQPLKRQPAARGWPNKGISVAYGLGRVPPERIGFRDTLILAFPEPQRPSRSAGSAALRLSLCPASRPTHAIPVNPKTNRGAVHPKFRSDAGRRRRGWLCDPRRCCQPSGRDPRYPAMCGLPPGPPASRHCRPAARREFVLGHWRICPRRSARS